MCFGKRRVSASCRLSDDDWFVRPGVGWHFFGCRLRVPPEGVADSQQHDKKTGFYTRILAYFREDSALWLG